MAVEVVEAPEDVKDYLRGSIAVFKATRAGRKHLVIVFSRSDGGRIYIAPAIPSPYCLRVRDTVDAKIVEHVLEKYGVNYLSACLVSSRLYRKSLRETIRDVAEELELEISL